MSEKAIIMATLIIFGLFNPAPLTLLSPFSIEEAVAQERPLKKTDLPDLRIGEYQFVPVNDKGLRVKIVNAGRSASEPCRLELTVRKINGTPVGRTMYQTIPAIRGRSVEWITLDAEKILPKDVALADTTFKLIADSTERVTESDENNNETWHNLR